MTGPARPEPICDSHVTHKQPVICDSLAVKPAPNHTDKARVGRRDAAHACTRIEWACAFGGEHGPHPNPQRAHPSIHHHL